MKNSLRYLLSTVLAAAGLALMLAGCGGGGGGGDSASSGTGALSLSITDAPVSNQDIAEVWVRFTQVIVKQAGGDSITINVTDNQNNPYRDIELTSLASGNAELLLGQEPLPAGNYSWIRLVIDPTHTYVVETQGGTPLVDCSSCDQSHLKLNRSFTIEEGGVIAFTVDFDLRKSMTLTMPQTEQPRPDYAYKLRPTLRIDETFLANAFIFGNVTDNRTEPTECWVYVYPGTENQVEPDDICITVAIDGVFCPDADRPLLEAKIDDTPNALDVKEYQTGYMLPDIYTVALVCEDDDPTLDEDLRFIGETEVDASDPADRDGTGPVDFVLDDIPELTLVKSITSSGPYTLGGVIDYDYEVTNTGNLSLTGPVTVDDDLATATCPDVSTVGNLDGFLNPGETITCTASYTVIAADVAPDDTVTNTATATADSVTSNEAQATADIVVP